MIYKTRGILGGTFDPIHNGHLAVAECAMQSAELDRLHILPCKIPVLKNEPHASTVQRIEMIQLAIADKENYLLDDTELTRETPSYMLPSLQALRQQYPGDALCLIIGWDSYMELPQWYRWEQILDYCHILLAPRLVANAELVGTCKTLLSNHRTRDVSVLHSHQAGYIYQLPLAPSATSSTTIRETLAEGHKISQHVPASVAHYIEEHQVYTT